MARVYSARFALASGGDNAYLVPAGKRVVVKCETAWNGGASAGSVGIWIGTLLVHSVTLAAGASLAMTNLHLVVNAGETVWLTLSTGVRGQMSGYLLDAV